MYYGVLVGSLRYHGEESLTYASDQKLVPGQLVEVALRNRLVRGIVEKELPKPNFKVKVVERVWPFTVPEELLSLLIWLKGYYPAPLGSLVDLLVPPAMPLKADDIPIGRLGHPDHSGLPALTGEQQAAFEQIQASKNNVLLHGDTGTGKTRLYIELAQATLKNGRSVLVLTPEIGLTQALLSDFQAHFGQENVLVTHSALSQAQRRKVWQHIAMNPYPVIVIGPRSALFSPIQKLGLVVIDEAHDGAYKQEQTPRYQASRVAAKLAQLHDARLILGSATPLISDYWLFREKSLPIVRLTKAAIRNTFATEHHIIDFRDKTEFSRSAWISNSLLQAIDQAFARRSQSLLFLNRRGSARLILCHNCGWQALCPNCDVPLTYHGDQYEMLCHSCGYHSAVPTQCPSCQAPELVFRVAGTKAIEMELGRLFPGAKVQRFDSDNLAAGRLHHHYAALRDGKVDIIIGTQTVSKGFDLPGLGVIGILQADSGLQIPDYTAAERTFQLLTQVSGRIGRGHQAGQLFVQTYHPDNPLIEWALRKDYENFYQRELEERRLFGFPPFYFLMKVTCRRASREQAKLVLERALEKLRGLRSIEFIGPSPRYPEKTGGRYEWQFIAKARRRSELISLLPLLPANCEYDLDPADLL